MSFNPEQLAGAIRQHLPEFEIQYAPDHRQAIADSWPKSIDDTAARQDWNWQPRVGIPELTQCMLEAWSSRVMKA
jgi:nucleoside-diphosphate-sugar epimerase